MLFKDLSISVNRTLCVVPKALTLHAKQASPIISYATGVLEVLLLKGNRADMRALLRRGSLTPGRLGYGDDSGREIQEKQKPAYQDF